MQHLQQSLEHQNSIHHHQQQQPQSEHQQQQQKEDTPPSSASPKSGGGGGGGAAVPEVKKERVRNLWGKLGKQPAAVVAAASSRGLPPVIPASEKSPNASKKTWDQVLNPRASEKRSSKKTGGGGGGIKFDMAAIAAAAYYEQHQQQQQQQQQHVQQHVNYMNAPNQSTTQCDCGEDTCQFCNLLLNMEMTDPNMLM